jgi:2-keto-4-pentenoate hydratase/2-oxohepta-3-ene-1,7-dioic acid hydratase in catechol pathway
VVNGEVRQQARTSQLEHGVAELLSFVSRVMTLLPGDVVLTGTPAGVGPLEPGDRVEVEVEGVGVLANQVVAEPARG